MHRMVRGLAATGWQIRVAIGKPPSPHGIPPQLGHLEFPQKERAHVDLVRRRFLGPTKRVAHGELTGGNENEAGQHGCLRRSSGRRTFKCCAGGLLPGTATVGRGKCHHRECAHDNQMRGAFHDLGRLGAEFSGFLQSNFVKRQATFNRTAHRSLARYNRRPPDLEIIRVHHVVFSPVFQSYAALSSGVPKG